MHWNLALDTQILLATLLIVFTFVYSRRHGRLRLSYPPGPPGLPLIGNILDLPKTKPWVAFADWSRKIGSPIIHVEVLGTHIVSVNDLRTARELLERRGSPHVSRPASRMITTIQENDLGFTNWPYDDQWKTCRRHADTRLRPVEARKLRPLESETTRDVLLRLLEKPAEYANHLRFLVCAILLQSSFGVSISDSHDPIVQLAESSLDAANDSINYPLVDIFPWVDYLPAWLPGMEWKAKIKEWKETNRKMKEVPFTATKQALQGHTAKDSLLTQLLEGQDQDKVLSDKIVRATALTLILAGLDTMVSTLLSVVLLSHVYPAVQEAAQAELDGVLGGARLPTFEDQHRLPFIMAFCKELLRYTCVAPLCLPHMTIEDDVWTHDGKQYLIPKGAVVMPNTWAMTRDADTYLNPDEFNPWRFLKEDGSLNPGVMDPSLVFGFRPRHCPGKAMAEDMLFIFVASFLAAFRVEAKGDKNIVKTDFDSLYKPGIILYPRDLPCSISPRSNQWCTILQASGSMD